MKKEDTKSSYTCNEYRDEMVLIGLQRRLRQTGLSKEERRNIQEEIVKLEEKMGL